MPHLTTGSGLVEVPCFISLFLFSCMPNCYHQIYTCISPQSVSPQSAMTSLRPQPRECEWTQGVSPVLVKEETVLAHLVYVFPPTLPLRSVGAKCSSWYAQGPSAIPCWRLTHTIFVFLSLSPCWSHDFYCICLTCRLLCITSTSTCITQQLMAVPRSSGPLLTTPSSSPTALSLPHSHPLEQRLSSAWTKYR
jgi:hypothetical protein